MFGVEELRRWRPDALRGASRTLRATAREVEDVDRDVRRLTGEHLAGGWTGTAADSAATRTRTAASWLVPLADELRAAAVVLDHAATAVEDAQRQLRAALAEADQAGFVVRDDGEVVNPWTGLTTADPAPGSPRGSAGPSAASVQWRVQGALASAREADQDAALALRRLVEGGSGDGWGVGAAVAGTVPGASLHLLRASGLLGAITLRSLPPDGAAPAEVARWWAGLSPEQRRLQIRAHPEVIGNLDGLPAAVRHEANLLVLRDRRVAIQRRIDELRRTYFATAEPQIVVLKRELAMLDAVAAQLDGRPERTLLLLDTNWPGRAAIAIGPVDTAKHVAVVVPGLGQDVTEDLDNVVRNADRLRSTAQELSRGEDVATVAWLGYETPSWGTVWRDDHAQTGAEHLRGTLEGVRAARSVAARPAPLHLTLVGHSYGSLTSGIAVREPTGVDELVILGSPGVGADHVRELQVPSGHVFVGEAAGDGVADIPAYVPRFGVDPSSAEFGAIQFQTDGGVDPVTGEPLTASSGHSEYFELGSESVRNIARIVTDQQELVTTGDMSDAADHVAAHARPLLEPFRPLVRFGQ